MSRGPFISSRDWLSARLALAEIDCHKRLSRAKSSERAEARVEDPAEEAKSEDEKWHGGKKEGRNEAHSNNPKVVEADFKEMAASVVAVKKEYEANTNSDGDGDEEKEEVEDLLNSRILWTSQDSRPEWMRFFPLVARRRHHP